MKVVLRSPKGKRLKTAKTVVREDVEVVPELQKRLIFENGTYTVGEGFAGIGEVVVSVSGGGTEEVEEWDGSGVAITPIVAPKTFTINNIPYVMDNRMTWYKWTGSDYNTDGFNCPNENGYVYEANTKNPVTNEYGDEVLGTQYISEGSKYKIKQGA